MESREETPVTANRAIFGEKLRSRLKETTDVVDAALGVPGFSGALMDELIEKHNRELSGRRANKRESIVRSFNQPSQYPRNRGCGHKFIAGPEGPRHRNCTSCWNSYFINQQELVANLSQNVSDRQGEGVRAIIHTRGKKFFQEFLKFGFLMKAYNEYMQGGHGVTPTHQQV